MKKNPLLRRLGASVSFFLLASALPASVSAAGGKHKPVDPKLRAKAKNAQHGAPVDPKNRANRAAHAVHLAHAASAKGHTSHFRQLGLASWYGRGFHGHRTANGEHYDMYAMTAAHRTLPLGSYVRVTSLASSKSVVVRINDRGPYARGRVIDLSYLAASALGMHRAGVTKVSIERVEKPEAERIAHRPMHLTTNG
ncbi:septal ring lytic transglycosylase RlpA family protein [Paraburkholderia hospita]|uniref:Endolytic peptidoglycan transglycosylase RlpA n=1 Tax=Paraburkholderia hospita TaxID=169430 RepID=A0AAN1JH08_9BURK|nr:septal ring lytic transglycosylase RlpA family protein [Paraburkholderia hospita]AUT72767.1 septal ring lytic transglycosylase RlpA family protein [Paraburkholderia hospita]EIN01552.1 rare lipoprotein A [Paraburkholderia hospita]OUL81626.1 septal ring lytic transglycosylase RlpA family lipoprotein [Paraburkholderia hospita]SEI25059.1 rare lipoprotein A [Paraburkholderia hospita]